MSRMIFADRLGYQSPFGKDGSEDWLLTLLRLLHEHDVTNLEYGNFRLVEGGTSRVGIKIDRNLAPVSPLISEPVDFYSVDIQIRAIDEPKQPQSDTSGIWTELGEVLNSLPAIAHSGEGWLLIGHLGKDDIEGRPRAALQADVLLGEGFPHLTDDEWHQIYGDVRAMLQQTGPLPRQAGARFDVSEFKQLQRVLQARVADPFYSDVTLCIVHSYTHRGQNRITGTYRSGSPATPCEITMRIVQSADGVDMHVDLDEALFAEHVADWAAKAKARGMDIDVEQMRRTLIADLETMMNETSWYERTKLDVVAWYEETIGSFVEVVQATKKIGGTIWETGQINESTWHSNIPKFKKEHVQWPTALQFAPFIGGAIDGIIDEIVGLPMACKSVYEICVDSEKRDAFFGMFSKEGMDAMLDGIGAEFEKLKKDEQYRSYTGTKTTVSIASSFTGIGLIGKAGKAMSAVDDVLEVVDDAENIIRKLPNPSTARYMEQFRKLDPHVEVDKAMQASRVEMHDLLRETGEFSDDQIEEMVEQSLGEAFHQFLDENPGVSSKKIEEFIRRGRDFDRRVRDSELFDYNQIVVLDKKAEYPSGHNSAGKPVRYVLDAYTPPKGGNRGLIVSSKNSDLTKIKLETFKSYVYELKKKYPPGAVIKSKKLKGELDGDMKLQFPKHDKLPNNYTEDYVKFAEKHGIEIIFFPP
ncbi:MAG: hypothetical protein QNJ44_15020 [Rhodobacter sp.]|nr:hypothetical protein [Rhodobacter sp.]